MGEGLTELGRECWDVREQDELEPRKESIWAREEAAIKARIEAARAKPTPGERGGGPPEVNTFYTPGAKPLEEVLKPSVRQAVPLCPDLRVRITAGREEGQYGTVRRVHANTFVVGLDRGFENIFGTHEFGTVVVPTTGEEVAAQKSQPLTFRDLVKLAPKEIQEDLLRPLENVEAKPVGLAGDAATRKASPIASGVLFYFPNALAAVAALSKVGNDQHNSGQPMHWAFDKSTDEADCILRHLAQTGDAITFNYVLGKQCEPGFDTDGVRHATKVAWRALALLERELLAAHSELQPGKNVRNFTRKGEAA